jgi:precorrin-6A/cobalt-precorrin-6A reductase
MILLFGGTIEGREVAALLEQSGQRYIYSTKQGLFNPVTVSGVLRSGPLDGSEIVLLCRERQVTRIIDAAHPFASMLHENIVLASRTLGIPVVRYERRPLRTLELLHDSSVSCVASFEEASARLLNSPYRKVLALTGVQSIAKLRSCWKACGMIFRILPRKSSLDLAEKEGFPKENLILMHPSGDLQDEIELIRHYGADCLLTKESAESGFLSVKMMAASRCGIPLMVIRQPPTPAEFLTVCSGAEVMTMIAALREMR